MAPARLVGLFRYPVKGLSPEPLQQVALSPGLEIPGDRRYAITRASTAFNPDAPVHLDKTKFLMLMRDERLAALTTFFDEASQTLVISRGQNLAIKGCLTNFEARAHLEHFFQHFMELPDEERPRIVDAPGHMFSDAPEKYVSIISLETLRDFAARTNRSIEALRFRGNLYIDGLKAWEELDLIGKELSIGEARVTISRVTTRCAATNVSPLTAQRDMNIPKDLMKEYERNVLGVYATVTGAGTITLGDEVSPV